MQIISAFPVPIGHYVCTDQQLINSLKTICTTDKRGESKRANSTVGGYQSSEDFLSSKDPTIVKLVDQIKKALEKYFPSFYQAHTGNAFEVEKSAFNFIIWGWYTVLRSSQWNSPHIHPRSSISGIFYVDTPTTGHDSTSTDYSGWVGFLDPRCGSQLWPLPNQMTQMYFPPVPGSLVIFPSYLYHFVAPFSLGGERISIAFNARLA